MQIRFALLLEWNAGRNCEAMHTLHSHTLTHAHTALTRTHTHKHAHIRTRKHKCTIARNAMQHATSSLPCNARIRACITRMDHGLHLPLQLPKLEDTLRRYLDSASVMVPSKAFERTREVVAAFGAGEGAELHAELAKLRDTVWKDSSYISEMWCVCVRVQRLALRRHAFDARLPRGDHTEPSACISMAVITTCANEARHHIIFSQVFARCERSTLNCLLSHP